MIAQLIAAVSAAGIVMLPSFARAERFGLVRILAGHIAVKRTIRTVKRTIWMTVH